MKLKLLTSAAAILALSAFTPSSVADKDLVGAWKLDAGSIDSFTKHTIAKVIETNPDAADQLEEHKDEIVGLVKSITITFKADNTYESTSMQGTKAGKWKFLNNGRTLEFTKADGTIRKDSVLELSATRLKMINRELKDTSVYVHP